MIRGSFVSWAFVPLCFIPSPAGSVWQVTFVFLGPLRHRFVPLVGLEWRRCGLGMFFPLLLDGKCAHPFSSWTCTHSRQGDESRHTSILSVRFPFVRDFATEDDCVSRSQGHRRGCYRLVPLIRGFHGSCIDVRCTTRHIHRPCIRQQHVHVFLDLWRSAIAWAPCDAQPSEEQVVPGSTQPTRNESVPTRVVAGCGGFLRICFVFVVFHMSCGEEDGLTWC
mmetsp:Transcript_10747/g.66286  ORF Transcript_10747/g.66286 Transcript_10747/m.66286 type:complete len:222 (-) Transcript_10747:276-941(-)